MTPRIPSQVRKMIHVGNSGTEGTDMKLIVGALLDVVDASIAKTAMTVLPISSLNLGFNPGSLRPPTLPRSAPPDLPPCEALCPEYNPKLGERKGGPGAAVSRCSKNRIAKLEPEKAKCQPHLKLVKFNVRIVQ
jgi:hypothetical protein